MTTRTDPINQQARWPQLGVRKLPINGQVFDLYWISGSGYIRLSMPDGREIAMWRNLTPEELPKRRAPDDAPEPFFRPLKAFEEFSRNTDLAFAHEELLRVDRGRRGPQWPRFREFEQSRSGFVAYLSAWGEFRRAAAAWSGNPAILVYSAMVDHETALDVAWANGWMAAVGAAVEDSCVADLMFVPTLLGPWEVRYPGPDGMIRANPVEQVVLSEDGTYQWTPTPLWSRGGGRWGLLFEASGAVKLCFETRSGQLQGNYLVTNDSNGRPVLNWQRTTRQAVCFADRVLQAQRPADWSPSDRAAAPPSEIGADA